MTDGFHCPFRDGRLHQDDQILAIDGQPLDISHQQAIRILQSARGLVELIIARGNLPQFDKRELDQRELAEQGLSSEVNANDMVVSVT